MFDISAETLIEGSARAAKIMSDEGLKPYTKEPRKIDQLKKTLEKIVNAGLCEMIRNSGLIRVLLFDDSAQQPDFMSGADGVCIWDDGGDDVRCLVGIGLSALERGEDYLVFLIFHEMCHGQLRYGEHDHDAIFHNLLDELLMYYNERTGACIENDYVGLPWDEQRQVPGYNRSRR